MEVGFGLSDIIFNALIDRIEVLWSTHFVFILKNEMRIEKYYVQYNNQIKDYNKNCEHDDAPDSLYKAVQLIESLKSLKFYDFLF